MFLFRDRKWHNTNPKHFVDDNRQPIIRVLYNELKQDNSPQHWVRTSMKALFTRKVYRRFFMKEQRR